MEMGMLHKMAKMIVMRMKVKLSMTITKMKKMKTFKKKTMKIAKMRMTSHYQHRPHPKMANQTLS